MSELESNKAVVRAYAAAMNGGDWAALEALFAPDAQIWGVLGWGRLDVALPVWRELHGALGMMLEIEALAAEGAVVAARYLERGTSRAPFRDRPATGRSYELSAQEWFELRDGLILRRWGTRDGAAQARQPGWS